MVNAGGAADAATPSAESRRAPIGLLLFALLGPPVAWSVHFAAIYFIVAAACAAGSTAVVLPIVLATVVAAALSVAAGITGYYRWRASGGGGEGSQRLVLVMGILAAGLFTLLIVLEALPPMFLPACPAGEP